MPDTDADILCLSTSFFPMPDAKPHPPDRPAFDDGRHQMGPLTDRRAVFELRTGALTTLERIERTQGRRAEALRVPDRLVRVMRDRYPDRDINPAGGAWDEVDGAVIGDVRVERPWHLLDVLPATLADDLAGFDAAANAEATAHASAVIDDADGPVILDPGATVGPLAVLQGPCYVGPRSVVMPHTLIRPNTVIGPVCKVAGEVGGTVFQGYSNKAHAGYLGDALVGEWVNLGAGTTASNLKNTYGQVRVTVEPGGEPQPTARQFVGPVLGDFVRTAIGTLIPTGAVIGTGCMLASTRYAPAAAPAFGFYVDEHGQQRRPYDFEKFLATAREMARRRDVVFSDAEVALLRDLHTGTATAG